MCGRITLYPRTFLSKFSSRCDNEWHRCWSCAPDSRARPGFGHQWSVASESRPEEPSFGPDLPAQQLCAASTHSRGRLGVQDPGEAAVTDSQGASQAEQHGSSQVRCVGLQLKDQWGSEVDVFVQPQFTFRSLKQWLVHTQNKCFGSTTKLTQLTVCTNLFEL